MLMKDSAICVCCLRERYLKDQPVIRDLNLQKNYTFALVHAVGEQTDQVDKLKVELESLIPTAQNSPQMQLEGISFAARSVW